MFMTMSHGIWENKPNPCGYVVYFSIVIELFFELFELIQIEGQISQKPVKVVRISAIHRPF